MNGVQVIEKSWSAGPLSKGLKGRDLVRRVGEGKPESLRSWVWGSSFSVWYKT